MSNNKISIVDPLDVPVITMRDGRVESRRLVTKKRESSERMSFHLNHIKAGNRSTGVVYPEADEINYMVKGEATITFDGKRLAIREGMAWNVPMGCAYDLETEVDVVIISVFSPPRE